MMDMVGIGCHFFPIQQKYTEVTVDYKQDGEKYHLPRSRSIKNNRSFDIFVWSHSILTNEDSSLHFSSFSTEKSYHTSSFIPKERRRPPKRNDGHLEVLQWCHANGCGLTTRICSNAALLGHLRVLIWCQENGCPWDCRTRENAVARKHHDIVQWCDTQKPAVSSRIS
jgi:hypothetical protein